MAPELLITVPNDSFHVKAEGLLSKSNYLDKFTGNCNWSVFGTCFGTFYYLSLLSSLLPSLYFTLYTEVCLFIGSNYFFFCIYLCLNFCICRCSLNIVQWRWSVFGRAQLWPLPCRKCIVQCARLRCRLIRGKLPEEHLPLNLHRIDSFHNYFPPPSLDIRLVHKKPFYGISKSDI